MSINLKRKKKNTVPEHIINEPNVPVPNNNIQPQPVVQPQQNYNPFPMQNFESIQLQRRLRMRHMADGAVNLNIENDDLANDNYGLYDDKTINLEKPKINENISKENTEYYIESIHHDQFFKITQTEKSEEEKKKALESKSAVGELEGTKKSKKKKKKKKTEEEEEEEIQKKPLTSYELQQITEKKIFDKFDDELSTVISKTISKVSLLFLFTQGLLAGMAILNIVLFMMYDNYDTFIQVYAHMAREMFNIFHTLTFASLVGNGIKFITALQKYNLIKRKFNANNMSTFTLLRKNMIFSGILLVLFTVTFGIEIYLATKIMNINYIKCPEPTQVTEANYTEFRDNLMNESNFKNFKTMYLAADFIVIVLFILNIFDVNLKDDSEEKVVQANVNVNYYMENLDETRDDI